jgi:DNA (cytosine-5)-methyltransferase 1
MDGASSIVLATTMRFGTATERTVLAADLFCGGGGTSTGLRLALERRRFRLRLVAVNHWQVAIDTHSANHPDATHFCQDTSLLRPSTAVPGGHLDLLVASPACTFHSSARGGRPVSDQQRMDPWHVITWLTELRVDRLFIENVPEFIKWGPVDAATGQPVKARAGEFFQAWLRTLRGIGFDLDWRIVNCADYGDPTSRRRFLLIARSDGQPLRWPAEKYGRPGTPNRLPWRTAREIIEWDIPGRDALGRPTPLKPATLRRLMAGATRHFGPLGPAYVAALEAELARSMARWGDKGSSAPRRQVHGQGDATTPVIIKLRGTSSCAPVDCPLPTITAGGYHLGVATPKVVPFTLGQQSCSSARSVDDPLMTVSTAGAISITSPLILHINHGGGARLCAADSPLPTVTCKRGLGVAMAMVAPFYGSGSGKTCATVDRPLDSVTTKARFGLVVADVVETETALPFLSVYNGDKDGRSRASRSVTAPMPSLTTESRIAVCRPVTEPVPADGFDLTSLAVLRRIVLVDGKLCVLSLPFRMLTNTELARAMSFPDGYRFKGSTVDTTRQIGNAVPIHTAAAHIDALFED